MTPSAFSMRRLILHQKQFRSLLSTLVSPPSLCLRIPAYVNSFLFFQAFRRTPSPPSHSFSHSLLFTTFQPSSPQSSYYPIDFNDIGSISSQNDELGAIELVQLLQKTKDYTSKKEVINFVADSGINPDAKHVSLAIWRLRHDWELALLAFELNQKRGFVSGKMLGLIVWVLGTHQKFDIAWSLVRDWHRFADTREAMLAIIDGYAAANNHEKAIKTFHFMEKLTIRPDQNAFYTVISALCRYGNIEEAEEFMLTNRKLFPLETAGFNIILHGWCDLSVDVIEAKRVWREMGANCITPDAMSYTHMISCFSRVGNLFDSLRLYDDMKKRGWIPSLDVYNSLIYVMAHENCLSEARKVLDKITEAGLQPDSKSYNCLICPLCESGDFMGARGLLTIMTQKGVHPTTETYQAFLKSANLEGTFEILSQMKKDKVGLDNCTFLLIFDRFFESREPENALKVWVEMRHLGVAPELEHYKSLISGLVSCGCLLKAKELHTEMLSNGFEDDPKVQKLLQGPEQRKHINSVRSMNFMRAYESKPSYKSSNRTCIGRKKARR